MSRLFAPFDILQWLSKDTARAIQDAAQKRLVGAGGIIYTQGDDGEEMFRLVSGSVRLSFLGDDGRDLLYQLFGPGDCFGTSSVVDGEPRPQTAEAFEAAELQVFSRSTINRLRNELPEINDALLRLLSRHMRLLSDYFASATLDEVSERLALRLLDVAETFGVSNDDGIALSTRLPQSELASMIGTARQTVNKALQKFQAMGWISIHGNVITITNPSELRMAGQRSAQIRIFNM